VLCTALFGSQAEGNCGGVLCTLWMDAIRGNELPIFPLSDLGKMAGAVIRLSCGTEAAAASMPQHPTWVAAAGNNWPGLQQGRGGGARTVPDEPSVTSKEGHCKCGGVIKLPKSKLALPCKLENVRRGGVVKAASWSLAVVAAPRELERDLGTVNRCTLCCGEATPLYSPPGDGHAVQVGIC